MNVEPMTQKQQTFESNNSFVESIEDFNTNETIIVSDKQHFDEKMDKIDDKLLDELKKTLIQIMITK